MAHLLSSERPIAAATSPSFLAGLAAWFGKVRARRTQRVALATLLEFDEHRLDDLGISRQDVVEAINHPTATGERLSARRASRATSIVQSNAISTALYEAGCSC